MLLQLSHPLWLLGLIPLSLLLGWGLRLRWNFTYIPVHTRPVWRWAAYGALLSTALTGVFILVALSEPVLTLPATRPRLPPLWVLWDVSHSMRNTDLPSDRRRYALTLWENALDTLTHQGASMQMGLIVFARQAYGLIPRTTNSETFRWALRQATGLDLGEGTDLAAALEMALSHAQSPDNLLIVSDGAHNNPFSADLRRLADAAARRAIPIHALWVGRDSATTFPEALVHLTERTGGRFWVNNFTLRPLYRYETSPAAYPLQKHFIVAALIAAFLMGLALAGGWFNLLSA